MLSKKTRAIETSWKLSIEAVLMTGAIISLAWMAQENRTPFEPFLGFTNNRNAKDE